MCTYNGYIYIYIYLTIQDTGLMVSRFCHTQCTHTHVDMRVCLCVYMLPLDQSVFQSGCHTSDTSF